MGGAVFCPSSLASGQTSFKRTSASVPQLPGCCSLCPWCCGRSLSAHTPAGDLWTLTEKSGSVSCWGHCAFFSRSRCVQDFVVSSLMLGKTERRRRRGDRGRDVGWHHWLSEQEFEQAPGDGERQGNLVCCSPRGRKELTWLSDWPTATWVYAFNKCMYLLHA